MASKNHDNLCMLQDSNFSQLTLKIRSQYFWIYIRFLLDHDVVIAPWIKVLTLEKSDCNQRLYLTGNDSQYI